MKERDYGAVSTHMYGNRLVVFVARAPTGAAHDKRLIHVYLPALAAGEGRPVGQKTFRAA